jgi:hypothetical protein
MRSARPTLLCTLAVIALPACGQNAEVRKLGLTTRVAPIVERACRQAAAQVSIDVVCPRLIPRSRYVTITGLWGSIVLSRRLWMLTFNNGDNGPGYVHWIVGVGIRRDVRYYVLGDKINEVKGLPKLVAAKMLDGRRLIDYRFPAYPAGGPNGGHAASFVPCGTRFVFASLHGYERMRMAELMAVDLAERAGCPR